MTGPESSERSKLFKTTVDRIRRDEGAGLAEYAFLLILIAAVVILVIPAFATAVSGAFTTAAGLFPN